MILYPPPVPLIDLFRDAGLHLSWDIGGWGDGEAQLTQGALGAEAACELETGAGTERY